MPVWQQVLVGIIPSIGVGAIFWYVMRGVIRADRNERAALAEADAAADAAAASPSDDAAAGTGRAPQASAGS
ncbi:hypothetical protein [Demequina iriomotensis]|uniref:hypothetical protein n=1 Tax=Demequina iriomotensis TaxID=1536641 RepID=UPI000782D234|nr:hypothetical protein [Demequina iriomotensis]